MNNSNPFFINPETIYQKIYDLFFSPNAGALPYLETAWWEFYFWLRVVAYLLSAIFLVLVVFYWYRRKILIKSEDEKYSLAKSSEKEGEALGAEKWQKILEEVDSINPNDWKSAIIDADSILDEMISRMGYQGENLGERLKSVERSDFETLNDAWEAHKVRNKIAHSQSDFVLNQEEARRAVLLYKRVFEEFHYI